MSKIFTLKSKTHRGTAVVTTLGALLTFMPQVQAYMPPEYYGPTLIGIGFGFHILRNMTTQPIGDK